MLYWQRKLQIAPYFIKKCGATAACWTNGTQYDIMCARELKAEGEEETMSNIKCKACGRRYNYRESDLCPHCGAYNKPTSRLRVDFNEEGSAELLHEQEFLRRSEAGQKRAKACYERKECHEDKVRQKGRTVQSGSLNTEQLAAKLREFGSQSGARFAAKKEKKGGESNTWYVVAVVIILMLLRACTNW